MNILQFLSFSSIFAEGIQVERGFRLEKPDFLLKHQTGARTKLSSANHTSSKLVIDEFSLLKGLLQNDGSCCIRVSRIVRVSHVSDWFNRCRNVKNPLFSRRERCKELALEVGGGGVDMEFSS